MVRILTYVEPHLRPGALVRFADLLAREDRLRAMRERTARHGPGVAPALARWTSTCSSGSIAAPACAYNRPPKSIGSPWYIIPDRHHASEGKGGWYGDMQRVRRLWQVPHPVRIIAMQQVWRDRADCARCPQHTR